MRSVVAWENGEGKKSFEVMSFWDNATNHNRESFKTNQTKRFLVMSMTPTRLHSNCFKLNLPFVLYQPPHASSVSIKIQTPINPKIKNLLSRNMFFVSNDYESQHNAWFDDLLHFSLGDGRATNPQGNALLSIIKQKTGWEAFRNLFSKELQVSPPPLFSFGYRTVWKQQTIEISSWSIEAIIQSFNKLFKWHLEYK